MGRAHTSVVSGELVGEHEEVKGACGWNGNENEEKEVLAKGEKINVVETEMSEEQQERRNVYCI